MMNPLLIFTLSPNFANTHCKLSISKATLLQPMKGMSLAALFVVNDANDVTAIIISVFVDTLHYARESRKFLLQLESEKILLLVSGILGSGNRNTK